MIALRFAGLRTSAMVSYLLLALLFACTSTMPSIKRSAPDIGDGGFLSGEPCGPPCFWGIVPGITKEAEVPELLKASNVFQQCKAYNNKAHSGLRGLACDLTISISFRRGTDTVDGVAFVPSRRITVGDVMAKYGPPEWVLVTAIGIPEYPKTAMSLYYNHVKTKLSLPSHEGITFRVEPSTEITDIGYAERVESFTEGLPNLEKWKGYGEYERVHFY